jgi:hypothetical protein
MEVEQIIRADSLLLYRILLKDETPIRTVSTGAICRMLASEMERTNILPMLPSEHNLRFK